MEKVIQDKADKTDKVDYRRGKLLSFRIKIARWIPWIKMPADVLDYIAEQAKEKAIKAWEFMQTERQLGKFVFRRQIDLNDADLDKMVADNQVALMGATREYSIVYDYLIFSGRMAEYIKYREQVEVAIQRNIAKAMANYTPEQIRESIRSRI